MSVKLPILSAVRVLNRLQTGLKRRYSRIGSGGTCFCVCCGQNIRFFLPYCDGVRSVPQALTILDVVGSDLSRYFCPKCNSSDRERHLVLYLEKLALKRLITGARILHFAPEHKFGEYITKAAPSDHVKADLFPSSPGVVKVDMLAMEFPTGSFDMVIANHVLEHVANDAQALDEIRRVLRPGGWAILQTPYSAMLRSTFEDPGIVTKESREYVYGQNDHVRLYGQDIFTRFATAGFTSRTVQHEAALSLIDPNIYGVNPREPFFLFERI